MDHDDVEKQIAMKEALKDGGRQRLYPRYFYILIPILDVFGRFLWIFTIMPAPRLFFCEHAYKFTTTTTVPPWMKRSLLDSVVQSANDEHEDPAVFLHKVAAELERERRVVASTSTWSAGSRSSTSVETWWNSTASRSSTSTNSTTAALYPPYSTSSSIRLHGAGGGGTAAPPLFLTATGTAGRGDVVAGTSTMALAADHSALGHQHRSPDASDLTRNPFLCPPLLSESILLFGLACCELFRRAIWAVLRFEHEHLTNASKYRAFCWVPFLAS